MNRSPDARETDRLITVERELRALRLAHDDLLRAHQRMVDSPGWRLLARIDRLFSRAPWAQHVARAAAARLASWGRPRNDDNGWSPRVAITATNAEQLSLLRSSPFFDAEWYRAQHPDVPADYDPIEHYFEFGASEGRFSGPLFNTRYYLANNPDVAAGHLNPLVHFHLTGAREGRTAWTSDDLLGWQASSIRDATDALDRVWRHPDHASFFGAESTIAVYVSSVGNFFFRDLAELCALGLREAGYHVEVRTDHDAPPTQHETALVMAPHEFYYLGNGVKYATDDAFLRSIPIGTEQWQTQWFARALPFMLRADRLLDINVQSADAFVRLGKQCRYLALGYSPDAAPSNVDLAMTKERPLLRLKYVDVASMSADVRPLGERPIDVLFVGALTSRRGDILAQLGPVLAGRNCFLHVTDSSTPLREGNQVDRELFALLARNSRVLLNIHHSEMPYFEWHRVVCYGIWQRSVVITETSFDVPYFREGQHYFGVPASQLGETIERVLASIDANAREPQQMVDESWRVLTERFALRDCVMRI